MKNIRKNIEFVLALITLPFILLTHETTIQRKCMDCGHVYKYEWKKCKYKDNCERCKSTNIKRKTFIGIWVRNK